MRLNETITQKSKILETIIKKIEKDFANDISVLVCYGSFVTGKMRKYSDIDFFFIPKTENGNKLNFQFIIKEIGYDLWPISWDRAEKISNLGEPLQSLFIDGKVLYFSTPTDLQKYEKLVAILKNNLRNKIPSVVEPAKTEKGQLNATSLIGFYEELKSMYNKLKFACETSDLDLATYSAKIIARETLTTIKPFAKNKVFPSLMASVLSKDFQKIQQDNYTHEKMLLKLLDDLNIPLNIFNTEEEFEKAFNQIA